MNTQPSNQPLTHWVQLLTTFALPGALQGLAFYSVAGSIEGGLFDWRLSLLWFLVVGPTCVFLISVPADRWRSIAVSFCLALLLSLLFYTNTLDSVGTDETRSVDGRIVALSMICSLVLIFKQCFDQRQNLCSSR